MAIMKKRLDHDPGQFTIYEAIAATRSSEDQDYEWSMKVIDELKAALNSAIKGCNLSRHQIAGKMSHLLNIEITKAVLDSWTAASKSDRHIPAEYLPAFCKATKSFKPMEVLCLKAGLFVLRGPEALKNELSELRENSKHLRREIQKREKLLELYSLREQGPI